MALTPRTVQNMPDPLQRDPIRVLQPASMTPEPTNRCWRRNSGVRMRSAFLAKYSAFLPIVSVSWAWDELVERREPTSFSIPFVEQVLVNHHPAFLLGRVLGVELASQFPQVFA